MVVCKVRPRKWYHTLPRCNPHRSYSRSLPYSRIRSPSPQTVEYRPLSLLLRSDSPESLLQLRQQR